MLDAVLLAKIRPHALDYKRICTVFDIDLHVKYM
jgi:hypothetical protein